MSNRKTCIKIDKKFSAIMAIIEKKTTRKQVCIELNIKLPTICSWLKNKEHIIINTNILNSFIS